MKKGIETVRPAKDLAQSLEFLTKVKDLAQDQKFEPIPPKLSEVWVSRMWFVGVLAALNWAGYEVRRKNDSI